MLSFDSGVLQRSFRAEYYEQQLNLVMQQCSYSKVLRTALWSRILVSQFQQVSAQRQPAYKFCSSIQILAAQYFQISTAQVPLDSKPDFMYES